MVLERNQKTIKNPENGEFLQSALLINLREVDVQDRELVGGKAANLAILSQAGFPVPEGYAITTSVFDVYIESREIPDGFVERLEQIKQKELGGKVALRSSATCEDGSVLSMAGVFTSVYLQEEDSVKKAMGDIYDHMQSEVVQCYMKLKGIDPKTVKMGLVLQRLVDSETAGVIYTGVNNQDILVQYVEGYGASLVDGENDGSSVLLTTSGKVKDGHNNNGVILPAMLKKLAEVSSQIKSLFQENEQDIEFAICNDELFVLQSRPLTTKIENVVFKETREETLRAVREKIKKIAKQEKEKLGTKELILSDSNYSELLPHPTEMDFGVFAYIFTGSDGIPGGIQLGRREMGYKVDDKGIEYTHYVGGRPYFSISMDALTYYAGFPETEKEYLDTLVNGYLEAVHADPARGLYPEMSLYKQDPTLEDLKVMYGDKAEDYMEIYQQFLARMGGYADQFQDEFTKKLHPDIEKFIANMSQVDMVNLSTPELAVYIHCVLEHLRNTSCVAFVKAARLGFYYSQRLQGKLEDVTGDKAKSEQLFARLNQGLDGSMITDANIAIAQANNDEEALELAKKLIGHYSTQEMLEIRHPLRRDDLDSLITYVQNIRNGSYAQDFERQKQERLRTEVEVLENADPQNRAELAHIIHASQTYMALRETIKYHFTREYGLIRDALVALNSKLDLEAGDIFYVSPREIPPLISDPDSMVSVIIARKRAFQNYPSLNLPHVIRENDIEELGKFEDENSEFVEASGKFLADGEKFEGVVVNADEFERLEDMDELIRGLRDEGKEVLLVAKQMNLGHDPYIAKASGLILENAGIVSHGAQRARELGRGALGGIKTARLKTGTSVLFDPRSHTVKKI